MLRLGPRAGQVKPAVGVRPLASIGEPWGGLLDTCEVDKTLGSGSSSSTDFTYVWVSIVAAVGGISLIFLIYRGVRRFQSAVAAQKDYEKWMDQQVSEPRPRGTLAGRRWVLNG